jgi:ELP3 family radical SAM enzyme/protein acetyltransferase
MSNSSYSRNEQIIKDIETYGNTNFIKHQDIYKNCTKEQAEAYVLELIKMIEESKIVDKKDWTASLKILQKQIKGIVGVVPLNYAYFTLLNQNQIKPSKLFRELSRNHVVREDSGIISVSVMTSPTPFGKGFSCAFDCAYCPQQPGGVRSYISDGPTAARGLRNDYDPVEQMDERITTLFLCGHDIDKLEVLVLGGTWDSYEPDYQEWFITRLYYASNTYFDDKTKERRVILSLEEEKLINETTLVRIIGLTLETRPDQICSTQVQRLLRYGCTRVQIGVQHIQDRILKKVKRDCYYIDTIRAIKNLKDVALKVDIHIMPQLPGATQRDDDEMFYQLVSNADLQADQLKIYPCETTPWTKIEKWFLDGEYTPYPNEDMEESVMSYLTHINPWQRINRMGRDALPSHAIAGNPIPNLGQVIQDKMKKKGLECRCIRCREVGSKPDRMARIDEAVLIIRKYNGSDGDDYFLSFETPDEKVIFGFCRLRLTTSAGYIEDYDKKSKESIMVNTIPILNECAFIRELHVYGRVNRVNDNNRNGSDVQHRGFGRRLIQKAEEIALNAGYTKMAIISGVGVREYYRKFGYQLEEAYMTKQLIKPTQPSIITYIFGNNYMNYFNNINNINNINSDIFCLKLQTLIISILIIVCCIMSLFNNIFANQEHTI